MNFWNRLLRLLLGETPAVPEPLRKPRAYYRLLNDGFTPLEAEQLLRERDNLKQLHQMRCPKCGMELKEIEVRGVQVDRCFSCNGTWLDAGELVCAWVAS